MKFGKLLTIALIIIGATVAVGAGSLTPRSTSNRLPLQDRQAPIPPRAQPKPTPTEGQSILRGRVLAQGTPTPVYRARVRVASDDGTVQSITLTDTDGRYEFRNLVAGRYLVSAMKAGYVTAQYGQRSTTGGATIVELGDARSAGGIDISIARGGVLTGRIADQTGEPLAGVVATALQYRFLNGVQHLSNAMGEGASSRTDDRGEYRLYGLAPGQYFVRAESREALAVRGAQASGSVAGTAPTYFPGTTSLVEAELVSAKAAQDTAGISFALIDATLVEVRGRVQTLAGAPPARALVTLAPADAALVSGLSVNAAVAPDGSFRAGGLAPGEYILNVRPQVREPGNEEIAVLPLAVGPEGIADLLVVTTMGAIVRGVITTSDGSEPPFPPTAVQIGAPASQMSAAHAASPSARVKNNYSFEISGLADRRYLRASITGFPDWVLRSVGMHGRDVIDEPMDFVPGREYNDVQLVFSKDRPVITGKVTNERQEAVVDATVVVFATDPEKWGFQSRHLFAGSVDTNGQYHVVSLPSGDYYAIAVEDMEPSRALDRDFLRASIETAKRISLVNGETANVDLRVARSLRH